MTKIINWLKKILKIKSPSEYIFENDHSKTILNKEGLFHTYKQ